MPAVPAGRRSPACARWLHSTVCSPASWPWHRTAGCSRAPWPSITGSGTVPGPRGTWTSPSCPSRRPGPWSVPFAACSAGLVSVPGRSWGQGGHRGGPDLPRFRATGSCDARLEGGGPVALAPLRRCDYPSRTASTSSAPPCGSLVQLRRSHSSLRTSSAACSRNSGRAHSSTSKSRLM